MKPLITMVLTALLVACSSAPKYAHERAVEASQLDAFMQDKPPQYRPYFEVYLRQGARNSVLNEMRIGLLAMQNGDLDLAAWLFDRAINKIETIYADNKTAKKARSKFKKEALKDFKGEPYERAMVYFYRGLIYLHHDDYENARASMLGGLLHDSMAEEQTYEQDFASHFYLAGWASQCNNNPSQADDYFSQAEALNASLRRPVNGENLLVLATSGRGPAKFRKGKYNEMMAFDTSSIESAAGLRRPILQLNGDNRHFATAENIHWQATTRGGRTIDVINQGKAVFKENTNQMGSALTDTGAALMNTGLSRNNRNLGNAGAVMALFGLVSKGVSRATKPTADIRYWDNLPAFVYLQAHDKAAIQQAAVQFHFVDAQQQNPWDMTSTFLHQAQQGIESDGSCDVLYIHSEPGYLNLRHINQ
ncbi:hypothetical protein [Marinicella meishanensis]|uniref:hypothetical protein n=1 Tax=Marinicella meishanensis TaxID=2873263 RepID=UPI001CBD276A|nr:hypothetical protein [Marinicella sp. NBU2979]